MSYIRRLFSAHIEAALPSGITSSVDAHRRFLTALTPAQRSRIARHWGLADAAEVDAIGVAAGLAPPGAPDAAATAALRRLAVVWRTLDRREAAGIARHLDGWGVVCVGAEAVDVNLPVLERLLVAAQLIDEPGGPAGARTAVAAEAADAVAAGCAPSDALAALSTAGAETLHPALVRSLAVRAAESLRADAADVEEAGARLRAVWLDALDGRRAPELAPTWLRDPPEAAPSITAARPLLLCEEAVALVVRAAGALDSGDDERVVALVCAAARDPAALPAAALVVAALGASPEWDAIRAASEAAPIGCGAVVARLAALAAARGSLPGPRAVLVDGPAAQAPSWLDVVRAARVPALADEIGSLCAEPVAWDEFDAPGEGALPQLWADALALAGTGSPRVESALAALGARDGEPAWQIAARWASPVAVAGGRGLVGDGERGAAAHGLHEGVGEAFGDVWSPHDPFSLRGSKP